VREQLTDLAPWRPVSALPSVTRDLSVVVAGDTDDETIGDQVRAALGARLNDIESVAVIGRTPYRDLPSAARQRLGLDEEQDNAVVRLVLRPLDHTLTDRQANDIRNQVYRAIHRGPRLELA
jgi:phenylalanyl-tRNA synthetase alpha chain